MIVWVSKEATGFPNDQRFEVTDFGISPKPFVAVTACGNGQHFIIDVKNIVGVEVGENAYKSLTVRFKYSGWSGTESASPIINDLLARKKGLELALKDLCQQQDDLIGLKCHHMADTKNDEILKVQAQLDLLNGILS